MNYIQKYVTYRQYRNFSKLTVRGIDVYYYYYTNIHTNKYCKILKLL